MTASSWFRRVALAAILAGILAFARASEPAIIARARAYVGPENALNGIKSVHYTGTLVTADPKEPGKQASAALDIIFQQPDEQRITATSDKTIDTTALDQYEGWERVTDAKDRTKWRQTLLGTDQIKRLRANTWENLNFFRGIESVGGRIEEQGTATMNGVACQKIAFIHAPSIIFYRYFDVSTGRLVQTETEAGGTIREQGEIMVNGIRFPKSIITTTKGPKGETQTVTITFDKITVNETFPESYFRVPPLKV
jgi:outer membrane lipoprotein-sorting protein